jgi:glycosyltransferase involved in cell wall biosynthesis
MHLTLFFTRGNSLAKWQLSGTFEREVALYRGLQAHGIQVSFVTYGTSGEESFSSDLPGIKILCNRWNLPRPIYEILCPWLHAKSLRKSDIFKTNQIKGAHTAIIAGIIWHKPVIVRLGYIWSEFLFLELKSKRKADYASVYENLVMKKACRIVVTTHKIQKKILERTPEIAERITIIPNYVDTELFCPQSNIKKNKLVIFIGRLSEQKNLAPLIEAISISDVTLKIIGSGPLEKKLQEQASKLGARVIFSGAYPNEKIPGELNKAMIFVLPSLYEGHPKALIEAMSCGLAVIGTDVDGIRDLIQHGETGWLCQVDAESIREAIQYLLANPDLCRQLGKNARTFILNNYSLDNIIDQEIGLYRRLLSSKYAHEPKG